jgi:hypothetical protein
MVEVRQLRAAGVITVRIEITEGFAEKCHAFVGGSKATTTLEGGMIVAKVTLAETGRYAITLRTSSRSPQKALGTAPDALGLALPVES